MQTSLIGSAAQSVFQDWHFPTSDNPGPLPQSSWRRIKRTFRPSARCTNSQSSGTDSNVQQSFPQMLSNSTIVRQKEESFLERCSRSRSFSTRRLTNGSDARSVMGSLGFTNAMAGGYFYCRPRIHPSATVSSSRAVVSSSPPRVRARVSSAGMSRVRVEFDRP